jgi:hypothetical protein
VGGGVHCAFISITFFRTVREAPSIHAFSHPESKIRPPLSTRWEITSPAPGECKTAIQSNCQARVVNCGSHSPPSSANFILVRGGDGQGVFTELPKQGVIVRPMDGYQPGEWICISIGTTKENKQCIEALLKVLPS